MMNETQKRHLIEALNKNVRADGRKLDEFRQVILERSVSETAEGSARVKIGNTEVMVGVKLSIDKPYPDSPDNGNLMVGAELLPLSNPAFELGPPQIWAIEIARVVDRTIREAKTIDLKKLCITAGEKIWGVSVDICTINDDGNLLDASCLATLAALQDTRFPKYDGKELDYRTKSEKKLPLLKLPISVTVYKIGDNFVVDPLPDEESIGDARLTVSTTADGSLCAMQKGGNDPLTVDEIMKMIEFGIKKGAELRKLL